MKKNLIIASLAIIISLGAVYSASAFQGNKLKNQEIKEELNLSMVNQDYNTWLELKTDRVPCKDVDLINEENFALFSEAHQLLKEGKTDEAKEIFEALGKEMPEKRMGRAGSFKAEGVRPHKGRGFQSQMNQ